MGLQTQWLLQIQEFINRRIRSDAWKSPGNLLSWTLEINFFPNRYSLRFGGQAFLGPHQADTRLDQGFILGTTRSMHVRIWLINH